MSSNSLLSISNLTVEFGGLRALADVFLTIEPHSVVGLIGSNGAGKSTIFRMIAGQFAQVQMQDAALGLLTVLAGVPRGWGRARLDLARACARIEAAD